MRFLYRFRLLSSLTALALLLAFPLASCKKTLVTKTLDIKLNADITLNVQPTDPQTGVWTTDLNPDDNVDVKNNRSNITQVTVNRLTYVVSDYDAAGTATGAVTGTGTWKLYPTDAPTEAFTLATVSNIDFTTLRTNGAEQELALSDAAKAKLVELIKTGKKITFAFAGSVSDKPVYVRFNVRLYTQVQLGV